MYFGCSAGNGKGNNLIVICSSDFAGITITCTNGVKTYSKVCPSSEPYEIEFSGLESGTWTISGTVEGTLYSTSVVIADYTATLDSGFDYRTWCTEGGVDATQYSSLADVFADVLATRKLMTVHASADYLIEAVAHDIDVIDDFCANDNAMKWIGLRDYVCDGLTAIAGVEAKFLASQYWERYLKDHVPIMTSNTAPYGVASAYQVFDGNANTSASGTDFSWKSPYPICVKKFESDIVGGTLQGSNDGTNYTDIATPSANSEYYMYHRVHYASSVTAHEVQFYGRALDVSVPIMTSNTAPYGEAFSDYSGANAYYAFDNSTSTLSNAQVNGRMGYKFTDKICVKKVLLRNRERSNGNILTFKIQGSNDNTWHDLTEVLTNEKADTANAVTMYDIPNSEQYHNIALQVLTIYTDNVGSVSNLQFYGVDYSEREFEPNSGKKWLYDHGLELETLDKTVYSTGANPHGTVTKNSNDITVDATTSDGFVGVGLTMDLTNYNKAWCQMEFEKTYGSSAAESIRVGSVDSQGRITPIATIVNEITKPTSIVLDISNIATVETLVACAYAMKGKLTELWIEQ